MEVTDLWKPIPATGAITDKLLPITIFSSICVGMVRSGTAYEKANDPNVRTCSGLHAAFKQTSSQKQAANMYANIPVLPCVCKRSTYRILPLALSVVVNEVGFGVERHLSKVPRPSPGPPTIAEEQHQKADCKNKKTKSCCLP